MNEGTTSTWPRDEPPPAPPSPGISTSPVQYRGNHVRVMEDRVFMWNL